MECDASCVQSIAFAMCVILEIQSAIKYTGGENKVEANRRNINKNETLRRHYTRTHGINFQSQSAFLSRMGIHVGNFP